MLSVEPHAAGSVLLRIDSNAVTLASGNAAILTRQLLELEWGDPSRWVWCSIKLLCEKNHGMETPEPAVAIYELGESGRFMSVRDSSKRPRMFKMHLPSPTMYVFYKSTMEGTPPKRRCLF